MVLLTYVLELFVGFLGLDGAGDRAPGGGADRGRDGLAGMGGAARCDYREYGAGAIYL